MTIDDKCVWYVVMNDKNSSTRYDAILAENELVNCIDCKERCKDYVSYNKIDKKQGGENYGNT
jgi:hypothetical protein